MKLNKKGFMLAEVVITSAIVMVTLVGLYTTFSKLYTKFNTKSNYDHVDAMYAARGLYDIYVVGDSTYITSGNYIALINKTNPSSCTPSECAFMKNYGILNAYLVNYDKDALCDSDDSLCNESELNNSSNFQDYVKYLSTSLDFSDTYNQIIVVELVDPKDKTEEDGSDNLYFGYFRIP